MTDFISFSAKTVLWRCLFCVSRPKQTAVSVEVAGGIREYSIYMYIGNERNNIDGYRSMGLVADMDAVGDLRVVFICEGFCDRYGNRFFLRYHGRL